MPNPTSHPGTYILVMKSTRPRRIQIGRLGQLQLAPGFYLYVGSAFGPGGVAARVAHHLRAASRPRWHIDYLRPAAELTEVWFSHDPARREHEWARELMATPEVTIPMPGFGASDCRCEAHLFYALSEPSLRDFRRTVSELASGHGQVEGWRPLAR